MARKQPVVQQTTRATAKKAPPTQLIITRSKKPVTQPTQADLDRYEREEMIRKAPFTSA